MSNPVSNNPNASLAAGSIPPSVLAVYLLGLAGVHPTPEVATVIGGAAASVLLFIGRSGIKGLLRVIWRGNGE